MLKLLKIKNIVLIDNLEIGFFDGLNVLTGETGAGKSIIFDSLNFVLGARSDKTLIRNGETNARVDAVFEVDTPKIREFFENLGLEYDGEILISRTMNLDGKSEIRVNGNPFTASLLKELTTNLVDIYGQQEQVSLLKSKNQLALLDNFGGKEIASVLCDYKQNLSKLKDINNQLDSLGGDLISANRERDYLEFVIKEIEDEKLSVDEENDLIEKKYKLQNMEKIVSSVQNAKENLSVLLPYLNQSSNSLNSSANFDSELASLSERLNSSKIELDDINDTLVSYLENCDYSQNEFDKIDSRLDTYKKLKRKYGENVEKILEFLQESKQKLFNLINASEIREKLELEKTKLLQTLFNLAINLNNLRKKYAVELSEKIVLGLKDLGMPSARVDFIFDKVEMLEQNLTQNGIGQVEMIFSANLGQELKPLNKVASGGELSRLMLALKSIVAETDDMPTMVFDEIDTGISGKIAQAVSEKMAKIAIHNQILVITHTVQIASMADNHFLIEKMEENGKTISKTKLLSKDEQIDEIARFISLESTFDEAKESAKQLINAQKLYKQNLR